MWSPWRQANFDYFKAKLAHLPHSLRLLDLGAGPLQFGDIFLKFKYTGVDFEKFEHVSLVTDLTKTIPLPDGSADIITLSNVIEHIPNTEHFLAECYRLLTPQGIIVGTVPFLLPVHQAPYDFNRYTHYKLQLLLEYAGFSEIEVVPLGRLFDAVDTIEQKTFDKIKTHYPLRVVRRLLTRLTNAIIEVPSTVDVTQGYGFYASRL